MYLANALSVDPGFNTGLAMWHGTATPITSLITATKSSVNPIIRINYLAEEFGKILNKFLPNRVIIEDQWFNEFSLNSLTSAKSGALKKLTWLTGAYIAVCGRFDITPEIISPISWKGNLNDEVVKMRVQLITGVFYKSSHIADAVGIGLNAVNNFIRLKGIKR